MIYLPKILQKCLWKKSTKLFFEFSNIVEIPLWSRVYQSDESLPFTLCDVQHIFPSSRCSKSTTYEFMELANMVPQFSTEFSTDKKVFFHFDMTTLFIYVRYWRKAKTNLKQTEYTKGE